MEIHMKSVIIMLKPASSLCDMRCEYCFYADVASMRDVKSYGIMQKELVGKMFEKLSSELCEGDRIQFTFQGGEPTLAGIDFYRDFVTRAAALKGVSVSYALQTNGLHIDREWCKLLAEYKFLVGISLDLPTELHDAQRKSSSGGGTAKRVLSAMKLMRECRVDFNVLCTLTRDVAEKPREVWDAIVGLDIEFTQFTPCLGELEGKGESAYALTPELFASFYKEIFGYWYSAYQRGDRRSIKLFDDVVNQMILGRPTGCGMDGVCRPQLVVEADGSTYPCDFYCLDEYKLGNIASNTLGELLSSPAVSAFVTRPHIAPRMCEDCPYRRFCGGNCKRMQREMCASRNGDFCGYRSFLDSCGETLFSLASAIKARLFNK